MLGFRSWNLDDCLLLSCKYSPNPTSLKTQQAPKPNKPTPKTPCVRPSRQSGFLCNCSGSCCTVSCSCCTVATSVCTAAKVASHCPSVLAKVASTCCGMEAGGGEDGVGLLPLLLASSHHGRPGGP